MYVALSDEPIITGECIASFSFSDDSTDESNESATNLSNNNIATSESASTKTIDFNNSILIVISNTHTVTSNTDDKNSILLSSTSQVKTLSNNKNILTDNRKAPIVNGCAPPIDGEYLDVKRTYMLRVFYC